MEHQAALRSVPVIAAPGDPVALADLATELGLDAVVLDHYELPSDTGAALRHRGIVVLAVRDSSWGSGQEADLTLDQNAHAVPDPTLPAATEQLTGLRYAVFRDQVLRHRGSRPDHAGPPRALVFFGGTDAYDAAPVVVPLLVGSGAPVEVVVVTPKARTAEMLIALPVGADQHVSVRGPVDELAELAVTCDFAVSAGGTAVWELVCLGVPSAVVSVTDNQDHVVNALEAQGLALPLGKLSTIRSSPSASAEAGLQLRRLAADPQLRLDLAQCGPALVDGLGRERVADALLKRVAAGPARQP